MKFQFWVLTLCQPSGARGMIANWTVPQGTCILVKGNNIYKNKQRKVIHHSIITATKACRQKRGPAHEAIVKVDGLVQIGSDLPVITVWDLSVEVWHFMQKEQKIQRFRWACAWSSESTSKGLVWLQCSGWVGDQEEFRSEMLWDGKSYREP
jgi:hypothetical protein